MQFRYLVNQHKKVSIHSSQPETKPNMKKDEKFSLHIDLTADSEDEETDLIDLTQDSLYSRKRPLLSSGQLRSKQQKSKKKHARFLEDDEDEEPSTPNVNPDSTLVVGSGISRDVSFSAIHSIGKFLHAKLSKYGVSVESQGN